MALATDVLEQTLSQGIKQILDLPFDEKSDSDEIKQRFADQMAQLISQAVDAWIKTATVTVQAGIPVSTAGGPTAQTGATTGPGTGTIA